MKITVIGLGYVGAVVASGLAAGGHTVLGVDVDRDRLATLQAGSVHLYEPGLEARVAAAWGADGCSLRTAMT